MRVRLVCCATLIDPACSLASTSSLLISGISSGSCAAASLIALSRRACLAEAACCSLWKLRSSMQPPPSSAKAPANSKPTRSLLVWCAAVGRGAALSQGPSGHKRPDRCSNKAPRLMQSRRAREFIARREMARGAPLAAVPCGPLWRHTCAPARLRAIRRACVTCPEPRPNNAR